jgi:hypothetical protein
MSATAETAAATRKRVSGQSPGESGSDSQNDHGLVQYWIAPFDASVSCD